MVSKITDKILPRIKEWQNRALKPVYPFVFMDAIHYKVREEGRIKSKAAYVVLGIDLDGFKDILGIWIGESESSKFWLGVLNELKNRGLEDVLPLRAGKQIGTYYLHFSSFLRMLEGLCIQLILSKVYIVNLEK